MSDKVVHAIVLCKKKMQQDQGKNCSQEIYSPRSKLPRQPYLSNALMMPIVIGASKRADTATADIAGTYLRTKMGDFTLIKADGELVDKTCVTYAPNTRNLYAMETAKKCCVFETTQGLVWLHVVGATLVEAFIKHPRDHGL